MGNKSSGEPNYQAQENEKNEGDESQSLVNRSDQKRQFDKNFKGPIENRSCTDVLCCILFCAFMLGMLIVGAIGFHQGQPKRLFYPTDSKGKVCGYDEGLKDKPFLYFFDLTKCLTKGASDPLEYIRKGFSCPTPQVCVSHCPNTTAVGAVVPAQQMICADGVKVKPNIKASEKAKLLSDGSCAPYYLKSKPVLYRCIPQEVASVIDNLHLKTQDLQNVTFSEVSTAKKALAILLDIQNAGIKVAEELKSVWYWLLAAFVISMVVSVIYIVLARWITYPLVVFTGIGALALLGYGTYYCGKTYKAMKDAGISKEINGLGDITSLSENATAWLVVTIILAVVFLVLLLISIFMLSHIRLACGLIAEASRAIGEMLSALFFPLLPWLLQLVWFAWFAIVLVFLLSNGTKQYRVSRNDTAHNLTAEQICDPDTFPLIYRNTSASCLFSKYAENKQLMAMQVYHIFGWLWGANFIIAFAECSLAGAFASYYFAFKKPKDIPAMPVVTAMWRALSYHCGSLAFGAAIIAIVQLIRLTLEYIHKKLKEKTDNPVADFIMICLKCCFWCLEKCLRFVNKNAYVMIAIYGKNFCASAKDAVFLLARNIAAVAAVSGVTGFILLIGKLLVTGAIGVASFFWFARKNPFMDQALEYPIAPVVVCTVAAYIVTSIFFSVYDMGIDTLFLCYLEDIERNDGSAEKPYYMTSSLQDVVSKHNVKTPMMAINNPQPEAGSEKPM